MKIYGVAILAGCYLAGQLIGSLLGVWLNIGGNVGGVGFAMVLLIITNERLRKKGLLDTKSEQGILFWSALYVPIVVAMSAIQNVKAALSGGWVAILAGLLVTATCFMLVPVLSRLGKKTEQSS
ncbi:MAG: malonate transporter subunit MadL [Roseivirga sp.]|nr:malonate transporter subunit MadL [Roseivirga sp.]